MVRRGEEMESKTFFSVDMSNRITLDIYSFINFLSDQGVGTGPHARIEFWSHI